MTFASRLVLPSRYALALRAGTLALLAAGTADAQPGETRVVAAAPTPEALLATPSIRVLERSPGRLVYVVEAQWGRPLAEVVAASRGDADLLAAFAVGGWTTTSEVLTLPAAVPPAVDVISADAEEVPLPGRTSAALAEALGGPAAAVVAVGFERARPTGTLAFRLLQVDAEAGVVRRYRRLVVSVAFPEVPPGGATAGGAFATAMGSTNPHLAVTRSALADGRWFRIPVTREGVYRIDRAYLQSIGVDPATTDPGRVAVYGNGGRPVPAQNSAPRPADLVENPTLVVGDGDGRFDDGDAIYFFAEAPHGWDWVQGATPADSRWVHHLNRFTTESAYFIRVDAPAARRVEAAAFPDWSDVQRLDVLEGRVFREDERNTIPFTGGGSGLQWLGTELSASRRTATVLDTIPPGLVAGTVRYVARAAARSFGQAASLAFSSGGATAATATPGALGHHATESVARNAQVAFTQAVTAGAALRVEVTLQGGNTGSLAWPDWIEAVFPQAPRAHDGVLRFATPGGQVGRFEVALEGFAAEPEVWDVTHPAAIRRLPLRAEDGRWVVRVEVAEGERPREVLAFQRDAGGLLRPAPAAPVANQNLHGTAAFADYVIVTPAAFRSAADELAEYRRQHDGLASLVVNVEDIYNEFSGGVVDMRAVRDYFKFLYDRATVAGQEPFRYGLLFGDGHHDFRGITPEGRQNNWVPVYQTEESFNPLWSYTSDDYYGLLDDAEGYWCWPGDQGILPTAATDPTCPPEGRIVERVDIGVGRIPARSAEEAAGVVRKIRHYESAASLGAWRSRLTLIADDNYPGTSEGVLFASQSETVGNTARQAEPAMDLGKIYLHAYAPVVTAQGRRVPGAKADAIRAIEEGSLIWNYIGHGGPEALADEHILTVADVDRMDNFDRLSVFATATCSFGRFDLTAFQSGAEQLVLNPNGGAVASFTTVRLVYAGSETGANLGLNLRLTDYMLTREEADAGSAGRPRRLGDIFRLTKGTNVGVQGNNRKFSLLGDPAMRIGLPDRPVTIDAVNGVALGGDGPPPEFRALERATVAGRVLGYDGQPDPSFDGEVELVVYDAERAVEISAPPSSLRYRIREERLYRGRVSVNGGAFQAEFIVPQDVSYSGAPARILAYARRADGTADGAGVTEDVLVSETAGVPLDDQAGPGIRLFLNDTTFVSGGLTSPDPVLIVRLEDESGINAVGSGVGHELLLVVDGDEASARSIGRFYEGDLDSYQAGTARVPLTGLAPGVHTLRVTAWDVANNASTAELQFVVSGTGALALRNVFNYPNPTPGPTRFTFEHNQPPGTEANVRLRIYTLAGRPVLTLDGDQALPGGMLSGGLVQIPWDGRDEDLDRLATGIYLWHLRVEVRRPDGGTDVAERVERLAVIR